MRSSTSFHLHSNDAAADGCLSGVLRRFLCGSLRRNDCREGEQGHGIDAAFGQEWKVEQKTMPSPGIVARLMGLESMPVSPCAASELVARSRSTNSLESWPGFLSERSHSPEFRTSQSFREAPTYLKQENEDFLLLSFTSDDREEAMASNGMRSRMDFREMKEKKKGGHKAREEKNSRTERRIREKKNKNKTVEQQHRHKEDLPKRKHGEAKDSAVHRSRKKDVRRKGCQGTKAADSIKPIKQREMPIMLDRSSIVKKKLENARGKVEPECSSQNSSPVSVLDLAYIDYDHCNHTNSPSAEEQKQPIQQSSRRKLPPNFENVNCLTPSIGLVTFYRDGRMSSLDKESKRSRNQEQTCPDFSDILRIKISRLAEEDLKKSTWISKETSRTEHFGDIAADLGLEILDLLLCEAVCELPNYII
ncbi:hypothetical protein COCNU_16G006600 [Cocos nucifera]|uniref:DUF3741 domain-containing protein n=1 Tax=Cocos nucifera TaxID=13894 RepID=A0A8K0IYN9_COCNU|nr:hypothetical protein COCNU_16G006600 [Cocos nucifera]